MDTGLPAFITSAQAFTTGVYDKAVSAIDAGVYTYQQLCDSYSAPVVNAIINQTSTATQLYDQLSTKAAVPVVVAVDPLQALWDELSQIPGKTIDLTADAAKKTSDSLWDKATGAVNTVVGAVADTAAKAAGKVVDTIVGTVSTVVSGVGDIIIQFPDIFATLLAPLTVIGEAVSPLKMLGELGRLFDMIRKSLDTLSSVDNWTASPYLSQKVKEIVGLMGGVGALVGSPMGLLPVLGDAYAAGIGELIKNESRSMMQPTRLGLPDYVLAQKRGVIGEGHFGAMVSDLGYQTRDIEVVRNLTRQLLSTTELTTLWRRGELSDQDLVSKLGEITITPEDMVLLTKLTRYMLSINDLIALWLRGELPEMELNRRLSELGVTGLDADYLKSLAFFIPGVQDLIHMAVREAFTPEIAERFGQYEDFPPALAQYGVKHGLSLEWAQRYWAAHWELPSVTIAFEMFQRKVISLDDLNLLLRALDVMPYWRDKLTAIAYQPITRVDIRRIHKLKLIDDAELQRRYEDVGYSPTDAALLALFTIELNREEEKYEKAPERDLTASEIVSAYASVLIDRSGAESLLTALGYEPAEIDLKLALAELPAIKRIKTAQINLIKQRLAYEVIDLNGAVDALNKLDLPPYEMDYQLLDIQMDLELAGIKKEAAAKKAAEAAAKKAAKAAAKKAK